MSFELTAWALKVRCRTAAQKLVLMALAHHAQDDGGRIYPGVAALAELAQITERSVRRLLSELTKIGLLSIVEHGQGGRGQATRYAMNVEMLRWLREEGADLGEVCDARTPWPNCRAGASEKPGHDVRVSAKTRTPEAQNPDMGCPLPPHTPLTPRINQNPPCARAREAAAADEELFEQFRAGYPKPSDGEWRVWGEVEFNRWPKLDQGEKLQAVASLPAFAAEIARRGRSRICNPVTYLASKRFVDYYRETTRSTAEDRVRIPDSADIWDALQRIWAEDNPGKAGSPSSGGGWWFSRQQIARAHRLVEAEAAQAQPEEVEDL